MEPENDSFSSQAESMLAFCGNLKSPEDLPQDIRVMNPYRNPEIWELVQIFYRRYYNDKEKRVFVAGINPGRLGGGLTGIPFTDPIRLERDCHIPNRLKKIPELSSGFIYEVAHAFGGPRLFYRKFIISSLCPLGFTRDGKNLNYYDDRNLARRIRPFIVQGMQAQGRKMLLHDTCICLGEGENFRYMTGLNREYGFFREIVPLPHPRWIMQYRRKKMEQYVEDYFSTLQAVFL